MSQLALPGFGEPAPVRTRRPVYLALLAGGMRAARGDLAWCLSHARTLAERGHVVFVREATVDSSPPGVEVRTREGEVVVLAAGDSPPRWLAIAAQVIQQQKGIEQ